MINKSISFHILEEVNIEELSTDGIVCAILCNGATTQYYVRYTLNDQRHLEYFFGKELNEKLHKENVDTLHGKFSLETKVAHKDDPTLFTHGKVTQAYWISHTIVQYLVEYYINKEQKQVWINEKDLVARE